MTNRDEMTLVMREALDWLAATGGLQRGTRNDFVWGVISGKTASALEARGLAERRYTGAGNSERYVYITAKGAALSLPLDEDELVTEEPPPAELSPRPEAEIVERLEQAADQLRRALAERNAAITAAHRAGVGVRKIARSVGMTHPGVMKMLRR